MPTRRRPSKAIAELKNRQETTKLLLTQPRATVAPHISATSSFSSPSPTDSLPPVLGHRAQSTASAALAACEQISKEAQSLTGTSHQSKALVESTKSSLPRRKRRVVKLLSQLTPDTDGSLAGNNIDDAVISHALAGDSHFLFQKPPNPEALVRSRPSLMQRTQRHKTMKKANTSLPSVEPQSDNKVAEILENGRTSKEKAASDTGTSVKKAATTIDAEVTRAVSEGSQIPRAPAAMRRAKSTANGTRLSRKMLTLTTPLDANGGSKIATVRADHFAGEADDVHQLESKQGHSGIVGLHSPSLQRNKVLLMTSNDGTVPLSRSVSFEADAKSMERKTTRSTVSGIWCRRGEDISLENSARRIC